MAQFDPAAIGGRIAQARLESGLTQDELATMASFSKRSLQDYERGVTIPYRHLQELGDIMGRSTHWFLHGDPEGSDPDHLDRLEELLVQVLAEIAAMRQLLEPPPGESSAEARGG